MKLRLRRAPLTPEDFAIAMQWVGRADAMLCHALMMVQQERRDADLMLEIAMNRHLGTDCEDGDEGFSLEALVLDAAGVRHP